MYLAVTAKSVFVGLGYLLEHNEDLSPTITITIKLAIKSKNKNIHEWPYNKLVELHNGSPSDCAPKNSADRVINNCLSRKSCK